MPHSVVDARMKCAGPIRLGPHDASVCAVVARLAEHVGAPVDCIGPAADRAPSVPEPLRGTRTNGAVSLNGAFGRAIRRRSVVIAVHHRDGGSEAARQAVTDLVGTLTSLRDRGLRGDCLVWVVGCEAVDARTLSHLMSLGQATGSATLLSVTNPGLAAALADESGQVIASGPVGADLPQRLADLTVRTSGIAARPSALEPAAPSIARKLALIVILRVQDRNSATLIARNSDPVSFRVVPVEITEAR